ncbi:hypothetical protein L208DRAFT_811921 [Tricholoma matsutake]|nr:hypothetical protein L208DRAFT_811921 [Tricholoma matsutake 945]
MASQSSSSAATFRASDIHDDGDDALTCRSLVLGAALCQPIRISISTVFFLGRVVGMSATEHQDQGNFFPISGPNPRLHKPRCIQLEVHHC